MSFYFFIVAGCKGFWYPAASGVMDMKNNEQNYLKDKLQKKTEHQKEALMLHRELGLEDSLRELSKELSYYDNHPADIGSETYEQEKQFALDRHSARQINEVNAAIKRMEKGTYGFCESCGREISFERLDAIPETKLCMECEEQRRTEIRKEEWSRKAEQISQEPPIPQLSSGNQSASYDGEDALKDTQAYGSSSGPQDVATNSPVDYRHTWSENQEDQGYVEEVDRISNEAYRQQLPDSRDNDPDPSIKPAKEKMVPKKRPVKKK